MQVEIISVGGVKGAMSYSYWGELINASPLPPPPPPLLLCCGGLGKGTRTLQARWEIIAWFVDLKQGLGARK